jgi:single-stranded DNA-specific DHH superfamily exonuclease
MEYLIGSRNEFFSFIDSISKQDQTAILTHTDLDGLASAVLLEEILNKKKILISQIYFLNYDEEMFEPYIEKLKQKKITKVFLLDLNADSEPKSFTKLRQNFKVFLIDHHPINENFKDIRNTIKTSTEDCSTLTIYELGEEIIDTKKWEWLVHATIISEFSYKKKENFDLLKKKYPEIIFEKAIESVPGQIAVKINNATTYYKDNLMKVYDLIKQNKLNELDKINEKIEREIEKELSSFKKEAEFSQGKNLYFYKIKSKYPIASTIATILSKQEQEKSFVIASEDGDTIKISARNQGCKDVNKLLRDGIKGIDDSTAGGHACASAAKIPKEYFKKFKENILNFA